MLELIRRRHREWQTASAYQLGGDSFSLWWLNDLSSARACSGERNVDRLPLEQCAPVDAGMANQN